MKIISLWQPWASLWAGGAKKIETRSWAPRVPLPCWFAVHAAKRFTGDERATCADPVFKAALAGLGYDDVDELPLGAVVGVVRVVRVYQFAAAVPLPAGNESKFGDYAHGRWGWVTDRNHLLTKPIQLKGQQGIWAWERPRDTQFTQKIGAEGKPDLAIDVRPPADAVSAPPAPPTLFGQRGPRWPK